MAKVVINAQGTYIDLPEKLYKKCQFFDERPNNSCMKIAYYVTVPAKVVRSLVKSIQKNDIDLIDMQTLFEIILLLNCFEYTKIRKYIAIFTKRLSLNAEDAADVTNILCHPSLRLCNRVEIDIFILQNVFGKKYYKNPSYNIIKPYLTIFLNNVCSGGQIETEYIPYSDVHNLSLCKCLDHSVLKSLSNAHNIQSLELFDIKLSDISFLSGLINLQTLILDRNKITNIESLSELTNLETLDLQDNEITDIQPIGGIISLRKLCLSKNDITDISCLSKLTELRSLDISKTKVKDISVVASFIFLETLGLEETEISDIGTLVNLIDLNYVCLSGTSVTDIEPLSKLNKLKTLIASKTTINQWPDNHLTALKYLDISNTDIDDISKLKVSTKLTTLILDSTKIIDVSPLVNHTKLVKLSLKGVLNIDVSCLKFNYLLEIDY